MELQTKQLLPPKSQELLDEIKSLFENPEAWLEVPNVLFHFRRPIDLIGTDEEELVRDVIEAFKYGLYA